MITVYQFFYDLLFFFFFYFNKVILLFPLLHKILYEKSFFFFWKIKIKLFCFNKIFLLDKKFTITTFKKKCFNYSECLSPHTVLLRLLRDATVQMLLKEMYEYPLRNERNMTRWSLLSVVKCHLHYLSIKLKSIQQWFNLNIVLKVTVEWQQFFFWF